MMVNDNPTRGAQPVAFDAFEHMDAFADWWRGAHARRNWRPIATLDRNLGDVALASAVILRSAHQWAYGHWYEGGWVKVTDGGHYRLDHFKPVQWAEPTLEDAMFLGQE